MELTSKQIALIILASSLIGIYALSNFGLFQVLPLGCKIIKPTWGYFECVKSQTPISEQFSYQSQGGIFSTTTYEISCNKADMVPEGFGSITSSFSQRPATCKIVFTQTLGAKNWKWCMPNIGCNSLNWNKPPNEVYLAYGESLRFDIVQPLYGTNVVAGNLNYYAKQLYRITWSGRKDLLGKGCDIRNLLPSSEWNKLPKDAELSLRVGQTINFIDTFIEVPTTGNYYNYNGKTVVAEPSGNKYNLYEINLYQQATPQQIGKYESKNGACYYTLGSFVAQVDCLPGQTFQGMTCGSDFKWHTLDKGQCIRGGIASDAYCPGGGFYVDPTTKTISKYTCNVNTGNCDVVWQKKVECYPGKIICPADKVCDIATYTCISTPQQLAQCPYDWCPAGSGYQQKDCPPGLQPCPDFTCKESCSGVKSIIPGQESGQPVGGQKTFSFWNLLWAGLASLLSFLVVGKNSIERRELVGIAIAGIIAIVVFFVVNWILKNLATVLLGSTLAVLFGGIILYFLGPVILFVVTIFMSIVREIFK